MTLLVDRRTTQTPLPLESGDRLSRTEFERRYQHMPTHVKAELVEGVVYIASPVRARRHALPHALVMGWLGTYWAATPGVQVFDDATLRLDFDNELQPDAMLCIESSRGGRSFISPDDYIEGVPELVVEIAASSAAYDLHDKLHAYQRNGVPEYLVWSIYDQSITWFSLQDGIYQTLTPDAAGVVRSGIFPGLAVDISAMLKQELPAVLVGLNEAMTSGDHQRFVARLADGQSDD